MADLILGIESSCDETACAVARADGEILSNAIASQVDLHSPYGGVVPELASRAHVRNMLQIWREALGRAGVKMTDISSIAVTRGPGLVGSLLAGFETAKAFGFAYKIPVYAIHHIAAHVYSPFAYGQCIACTASSLGSRDKSVPPTGSPTHLSGEKFPPIAVGPTLLSGQRDGSLPEGFDFPYLALAVSGGHTSLILAKAPDKLEVLGRTRDDAAGEAYDKVAKLVGLGYPGGPIIDRLAANGDPQAFRFTRAKMKNGEFDFSFSGLKTAVARLVKEKGADRLAKDSQLLRDLAASFQDCVIDSLLINTEKALVAHGLKRLAVVGGVACNKGLRAASAGRLRGISLVFPPPALCGDNAAMIAALAGALGERAPLVNLSTNVDANLAL